MIPGGLGTFLPRLSLGRPIGVVVVVGAVLVMGLVAALSLPIELIPSGYSSPFLRVTVPWRDAPPQELLDKITIPLEEELSTVRGLENQFSFCAVGFTQVFLSFAHGTDMDVAYREVRDRIERARARMPDDVEQVLIRKDDDAMMPVAMVGLIVEEETADVYNLVQNEVILRLERVPGVASVDAQGLLEREVLIELDRQRVEAAGLNIVEIAQDLASDYFTLASGNVRAGDRKLLLRSVARYPAPQNVRDMWITDTVRLGDIASVRYDVPDDEFRVRVNGLPAYAIQVQKGRRGERARGGRRGRTAGQGAGPEPEARRARSRHHHEFGRDHPRLDGRAAVKRPHRGDLRDDRPLLLPPPAADVPHHRVLHPALHGRRGGSRCTSSARPST